MARFLFVHSSMVSVDKPHDVASEIFQNAKFVQYNSPAAEKQSDHRLNHNSRRSLETLEKAKLVLFVRRLSLKVIL
jgi:hypothetical protein